MALSVLELARSRAALRGEQLLHVQRLAASWQPLADFCFSDLLLLAAVTGEEGHRFAVLAQVRPTTGQTLYPEDLVGTIVAEVERPLVARAWRKGEITGGDATVVGGRRRCRLECIPVRHEGALLGVVSREAAKTPGRRPGELERQYLQVFDRFAHMIAEGSFPFADHEITAEDAPRVSDGVIVLDGDLRLRFASPNAVSVLHRMGIHSYTPGLAFAEMGLHEDVAEIACRSRRSAIEEVERGDTTALVQVLPMLERDNVVGAVVMIRDVTDLRLRDRLLVSKDATIREIHHRVKNNLQTIAALLRLQGRRLTSPEAHDAIAESERRIRSIAIVHETLSREITDAVPFSEILRQLVRQVEETVSSDEVRLRFEVEGDAGEVPGDLATPLAVVLNELMQNAVDHAFPVEADGRVEGRVVVRLERGPAELHVDVVDDGTGLPAGFVMEDSLGLGLSIVHSLVTTELGGSIEMTENGGTRVHLRVPLRSAPPLGL